MKYDEKSSIALTIFQALNNYMVTNGSYIGQFRYITLPSSQTVLLELLV